MPYGSGIIPEPLHLKWFEGGFTLSPTTPILADERSLKIVDYFRQRVKQATGYDLPILKINARVEAPCFEFRFDRKLAYLGVEGYTLKVKPEKVTLTAPGPAGLFYAVQTLCQLFPVEVFSKIPHPDVAWTLPGVEIEDMPRFVWRGAMLDVCRHFMPKEFVLKFIDLLAMHKMNVFHWHLTDDQGWRIEIKKYPLLTEVGAWRKETRVGHENDPDQSYARFDGKPHGGFYSQEDIREIVAYAGARFINIVPEIEMPGHAQAAIAAYPHLGNTPQKIEVGTVWGIYENIYNVEESTFCFLQDVLEEVMALFPGPYIHVGGDEVLKKQWDESPAAMQRLQELHLGDSHDLQSYFIGRIDSFLSSKKRCLVGWDEILEGGLAPHATVMSWRGEEGGITAVNAGHPVVMAPYEFTYLDYCQSQDTSHEPLTMGGYLPLEKVYGYEPVNERMDPEKSNLVMGAQVQLWTEYMPDFKQVEYMAFPRLCALAEGVWTAYSRKDYSSFLKRLKLHLRRLDLLNVNYHPVEE